MKLLYEGVDIAGKISINQCEHETYAEKRRPADSPLYRLARALELAAVRGEKVALIDEGDTGVMYIPSIGRKLGFHRGPLMPLSGETVNNGSGKRQRRSRSGRTS